MNQMLFLICLWLAFLGGLEGRAWGMALSGRDTSIHAYEGRDVLERGQGAVPSEDAASVAREGMTGHDYGARKPRGFSGEVGCLERMQDGPNLYAYVMQNPWSCFDPKGLSKEWHHDLPKDHEERFKKYDIDVHDSKNGSFLDAEKHNQLHSKGKYNQHWSDFLDKMDNITDSAKAKSEILNHMEDIRGGKIGDFAGYYKDAVRVGEGLNYNTHWHFKNGTLSSKQRGQVITAALDAGKMGKGIAFDVGKQFGRKLPIVKYAMGGLAFSAGQSFAKETLGMSDSSARMVGFIEALNPAPLGVQDLYELGQDNLQLQAGRRQADIDNIGRTGYPLYMFSSWNRFNTPDPPQEWTQNPQGHMPELIQHWGR